MLSPSMAAFPYEEQVAEEPVVGKVVIEVLGEAEEGGERGGFVHRKEKTGFGADRP